MINSENIEFAFTKNTSENATSNSLLIAYGNKSVELKIIKDTISMYQNSSLETEKVLKEEKQKLKELNYQVWSVEDSFCEQVWQFSHKHNFSDIFKYYPFIIKTDHYTKQKRNNDKDDIEKSSSELITDLINEIDTIRAEIFSLNREKNVKQEMESTLMDLRQFQLIADDITELLRLISPLEFSFKLPAISIPIYDECISNQKEKSVKNKLCLKNGISNFMPKKITIMSSKIYPQLSLERSIVHTVKTMMTNISNTELQVTCNEKHKNFTPKKRSEISIKFEQYRHNIIDNY